MQNSDEQSVLIPRRHPSLQTVAMKRLRKQALNTLLFLLLAPGLALTAPAALAYDTDKDGLDDSVDNCLLIANVSQHDSDNDGYGGHCDADFNNDGVANFVDLQILSNFFLTAAPFADPLAANADMNGDGIINFVDALFYREHFLRPPGPADIDLVFDASEAARLLNQATFGPTLNEIQALALSANPEQWITQQFATPQSSHEILTRTLATEMCLRTAGDTYPDGFYNEPRQAAWWIIAIDGQDQLRQRVAFALSEIFVVSDRPDQLAQSQFGLSDYYDMLATHSSGNFRDLLEDVTLHATMGMYLSMVRNEPPSANIHPDENYARELLQLFSLGVHLVNPDGSKILDGNLNPIPSYTQTDIENFARVFTGWNFAGINWWQWMGESDRTLPMVAVAQYHDTDAKTLLLGQVLAANQSAEQDMNAAMDNVFNHPNVAPFISQLLIKRLVSSNPTPGYIARVAAVFDNNGSGVRGDLQAVVTAILMDAEARVGHKYLHAQFGKLREPLLRLSHVRRAFNAAPVIQSGHRWDQTPCGQPAYAFYPIPFGSLGNAVGQQVLNAPSVFNFFSADFSPPGTVRDSGLVGPEFALFTTSLAQSTAKVISFEVQNNQIWGPGWIELDISQEIALASNPTALVDHLDTKIMNGSMDADIRSIILSHLNDPSVVNNGSRDEIRARDAIMLLTLSPDYLIQR